MVATFVELKAWLAALPDQAMGTAGAVCETGEPYVEFAAFGIARPRDEAAVEAVVAECMERQIQRYFEDRKGRIYWRVPLETAVDQHAIVIRYDVNGPGTDFLTDQRCVLDKNWVRLAAYCRLYKAKRAFA